MRDDLRQAAAEEGFEKGREETQRSFILSMYADGMSISLISKYARLIEDAGIINRCHNMSITELPLDGNAIDSEFKIYMEDTGLFVAMLEPGTQADIR